MKFLFSCLILISLQAHAFERSSLPENASLQCMTEFATTSMFFGFHAETSSYRLRVIHHNGVKWMPIHKGTITLNDLQTLNQRGNQLALLGSDYILEFKKEDCHLVEAGELVCYGRTPVQVGEQRVETYSFHNYHVSTRLYGQNFKTHVLSLGVRVGNQILNQSMDYAPTDCRFQNF